MDNSIAGSGLSAERGPVRVGFRYQDGEVLSPERQAMSQDAEIPEKVFDLGDGEWLTLSEVLDAIDD